MFAQQANFGFLVNSVHPIEPEHSVTPGKERRKVGSSFRHGALQTALSVPAAVWRQNQLATIIIIVARLRSLNGRSRVLAVPVVNPIFHWIYFVAVS